MASKLLRVSVIGSGNWGTAVARIIAQNVLLHSSRFSEKVLMYVYPEQHEGKDLGELINLTHENPKYLPGVKLTPNVVASGDMEECVKPANILVFVLPHQFVPKICNAIKPSLSPNTIGVSLIKGLFVGKQGIQLVSQHIGGALDIPMTVVSGANVAKEVARETFAEATLGYDECLTSSEEVETLIRLFDRPYFRVTAINDVAGVELQGALKNIIALAAGFVDGLSMGSNTKAAILRIGMKEMQKFCFEFFRGVKYESFFESCGVADVITTCYAGRNRRCAEEFVRSKTKSWDEIEQNLLNGQRLQGTLTAQEVHEFLSSRGRTNDFPFFTQVYKIAFEGADPFSIVEMNMH